MDNYSLLLEFIRSEKNNKAKLARRMNFPIKNKKFQTSTNSEVTEILLGTKYKGRGMEHFIDLSKIFPDLWPSPQYLTFGFGPGPVINALSIGDKSLIMPYEGQKTVLTLNGKESKLLYYSLRLISGDYTPIIRASVKKFNTLEKMLQS